VATLEGAGDDRELAYALGMLGMALIYAGDLSEAENVVQRGETLARTLNDPLSLMLALSVKAQVAIWTKQDFATAQAALEEELQYGRQSGNSWLVAEALFGAGLIAYGQSDWATAQQYFAEAHELFQEMGDRNFANMAYSGLADLARHQGDLPRAAALYREIIAAWHDIGHRAGIVRCLECLGFIAGAQGQFQRAASLFGAAEAQRQQLGNVMMPDETAEYDRELSALRVRLGDATEAFEAAWQAGQKLDFDAAIRLGLAPQQ
jgi:non-specific serine/threonine protein kinase